MDNVRPGEKANFDANQTAECDFRNNEQKIGRNFYEEVEVRIKRDFELPID